MIEPNELRMQNVCAVDGNTVIINTISKFQVIGWDLKKEFQHHLNLVTKPELLQGVLLTEEWLLKFGFKGFGGRLELNTGFYEFVWKGELYLVVEGQWLHINCNNVHQLQNIYFALAGQELTFTSE